MYLEFASLLRQCRAELDHFDIPTLAEFFDRSQTHFNQVGENGPILYHQFSDQHPLSYVLRGTIFWPKGRQIVRGYPRILPSTDHTPERFSAVAERQLIDIAKAGELLVEDKVPGVTIRLYRYGSEIFYATDNVYDGGDPLIGSGIDNVRALGIDYGAQAGRLIEEHYPRAARLADIGYTFVFEMLLPECQSLIPVDRADLVLVDVIDPDFNFVDRLEKERIAEDYNLKVVPVHGKLRVRGDADGFFKQLRGLEHIAAKEEKAGFVVKGRLGDSDQIFLKAEPLDTRDWKVAYAESDLTAIYETILEDFGPIVLRDPLHLEEMMLDYLHNHRRTARWQVQDFLTAMYRRFNPPAQSVETILEAV